MTDQTTLEERIAHLERVADDLSEVLARQDAELARLTRRVEMLMMREAERETDAGGTVPLADQKPPHW
jgi:SlyX protein